MQEAFARFTCPACSHEWEREGTLPAPDERLACDGCDERRPASEFARADGDVETLRQFA